MRLAIIGLSVALIAAYVALMLRQENRPLSNFLLGFSALVFVLIAAAFLRWL